MMKGTIVPALAGAWRGTCLMASVTVMVVVPLGGHSRGRIVILLYSGGWVEVSIAGGRGQERLLILPV